MSTRSKGNDSHISRDHIMSQDTIFLQDYTKYLFGRFRTESEKSAEAFRDDVLLPSLLTHDLVTLDISMKYGFPASSLEEIFGGLVRHSNMTTEEILNRLNIVSDCEFNRNSALTYIRDAAKNDRT